MDSEPRITLERLYHLNKPIRFFYGNLIVGVLILGIPVLRNLDILQFYYRPPDLFFWIYILTFFFGMLAVYQMYIYFKQIGSFDYLLIASFIYWTAILFIWQLWTDYLTPIGGYINDSRMDLATEVFWPEVVVGRLVFWTTYGFLIIHVVRMYGWNNYNSVEKVMIILLSFMYVMYVINDGIRTMNWQQVTTPQQYTALLNAWYTNLDPLGLLGLRQINRTIGGMIPPVLVIYSYVKFKPLINTNRILVTRIGWLLFGFAQLSIPLGILIIEVFNTDPYYFLSFQYQVTLYLASNIILSLVLILLPEAFLISKTQLFQASKLYRLLQSANLVTNTDFSLINSKNRFIEYLKLIPTDIKDQLKEH